MNPDPSANGFPANRLRRSMAALAHDATSIAELQVKLVALDLKDGSKFVRNATILAVVGIAFLLACLPVGMLAVAELIVALTGWQTWVAYLVTAVLGLIVGLGLLWASWLVIRKTTASFERSREELSRNVEWFKEALRRE